MLSKDTILALSVSISQIIEEYSKLYDNKRRKKIQQETLAKGVYKERRNLSHIKFRKLFSYEKRLRKYLMKLAIRIIIYSNITL